MDHGERRIRSLKLSGHDDSQLLQARYHLEEAFRTASFPGLPPNAEVVIRHLDLGAIRLEHTSLPLAAKITDMIRNLASEAVCVDHQSHPTANIVWFSDSLQVYKVLLTTLLDNKAADEWYWRSLFPNQALELNQATIEMLLLDSRRTVVNALAPAYLLESCLEPRRLARLFGFLTPALARRMLHELGLSPVAAVSSHGQSGPGTNSSVHAGLDLIPAPNMSLSWRKALLHAVSVWGEQDVRTAWLAYHALIIHQPAYLQRKDSLQRIVFSEWLKQCSFNGVTKEDEQKVSVETNQASSSQQQPEIQADSSTRQDAISTSPAKRDDSQHREELAQDFVRETQLDENDADAKDKYNSESLTDYPFVFSDHAGFAFVISLLQRLGMTELLMQNEKLIANDFPRQLLWALAQRLGLIKNDPCWQLFENLEPQHTLEINNFIAPDIWWRIAMASGRLLRRYRLAQSGRQAIAEPGGRWLLFWGDETDAACSGLLSEVQVEEAGLLLLPLQMVDLTNSMQLVAATYLRRLCAVSLRTLVQRPGQVGLTTTHWDVVFDINTTDLRLRRVALDSDPGWMPWLGKVVQFHFDSEGQANV